MEFCGIDVGSRSIKAVWIDALSGTVVESRKVPTTYHPLEQSVAIAGGRPAIFTVATGYGRKLVQGRLGAESITEIMAHALGAGSLPSDCCSVLDIGGQDTKAILLDPSGRVAKFEMNDRCAAGTGKFLEFMASSFQVPMEQFGDFALEGVPGLTINSMCTVFAESEATTLMAGGHRPQDIALALHESVVTRCLAMLKRVAVSGPLVFSGGVALNRCIATLIRERLDYRVVIPQAPDMLGALGAALHAAKIGRRHNAVSGTVVSNTAAQAGSGTRGNHGP